MMETGRTLICEKKATKELTSSSGRYWRLKSSFQGLPACMPNTPSLDCGDDRPLQHAQAPSRHQRTDNPRLRRSIAQSSLAEYQWRGVQCCRSKAC